MTPKQERKQLQLAFDAGELGMQRAAEKAGETFAAAARQAIIACLRLRGEASGETLVDYCVENGIDTPNHKAFGPVVSSLKKDGIIVRESFAPRRKGHGAPGASVWRLSGSIQE